MGIQRRIHLGKRAAAGVEGLHAIAKQFPFCSEENIIKNKKHMVPDFPLDSDRGKIH